MHPSLRYFLIVVSVGGGFAGFSDALQKIILSWSDAPTSSFVLLAIMACLFAFVTYSGVAFIDDPQRLRPLLASFLIQTPVFFSPLISFKFGVGLPIYVYVVIVTRYVGTGGRVGFDFTLSFLKPDRFTLGLNLFALAIVIWLVLHAVKRLSAPNQSLERTDSAD
jgi:hypothetical protein